MEVTMGWAEEFQAGNEPDFNEIASFVGSPLWEEMNRFLQEGYDVTPETSHSTCSGQPGWNVKYRKGGRSLCTLYPMEGYFIALIVIGSKEYDEALEVLPGCTDYTRQLFKDTPFSAGGRWLMMEIADEAVLGDAKRLIQVRRKIRK